MYTCNIHFHCLAKYTHLSLSNKNGGEPFMSSFWSQVMLLIDQKASWCLVFWMIWPPNYLLSSPSWSRCFCTHEFGQLHTSNLFVQHENQVRSASDAMKCVVRFQKLNMQMLFSYVQSYHAVRGRERRVRWTVKATIVFQRTFGSPLEIKLSKSQKLQITAVRRHNFPM